MESLADIKVMIEAAVPGAELAILNNDSPCGQHSLIVGAEHGEAVARFLCHDERLRLDYCSNATGVDHPDRVEVKKEKVTRIVEGEEKEETKETEIIHPGFLEAVYHLYSMALKQGPVIIRLRTGNRGDDVKLPSLTPVWRSCDFQEREIYDLYGIEFTGHPDLRRILMWDEFTDFPMRKDYREPDDYEYEPTPHDEVLEKAKAHF